MHHFAYRDGVLHAEAVNLITLADAVGTPFYCYSSATIERHYKVFAGAFADVDALVERPELVEGLSGAEHAGRHRLGPRQGIKHQSRAFVIALIWPSLSSMISGRPWPSHTACSFEFKPPFVRPIRRGTAPFLKDWRRCDEL